MPVKNFLLGFLKLLVFITGLFVLGFLSALITINLVMQKEQVKVPSLIGKDVVDALEEVNSLGLNLVVEGREFHSSLPANAIISQTPEADKLVKSDRDIRVTLSKGTQMVILPDLMGESWLSAQAVLQKSDLKTGCFTKIYHPNIRENIVINQDPPSGYKIRRGGAVNLLISLGQEPVSYCMPELIGKSLDEAKSIIQDFHITIGKIDYEIREGLDPHTVIVQHPESGYRILQGAKVNLRVSKGKSIEEEIGTYKVLQYNVPAGSTRRTVRIVLKDDQGEKEIFHEEKDPGSQIELLVKVTARSVALIYLDENLVKEEQFR